MFRASPGSSLSDEVSVNGEPIVQVSSIADAAVNSGIHWVLERIQRNHDIVVLYIFPCEK